MSLSPFTRLAGPLSLTAGALLTVQQIMMFVVADRNQMQASMAHPLFVPLAIAYFLAFIALLAALVAVYDLEARQAGTLGVVGFFAALVGTMFLGGDLWFEAFVVPWVLPLLANVPPETIQNAAGLLVVGSASSSILFALGWVLFGVASFRARVFPTLISLALVAGGVSGYRGGVPPYSLLLGLTFAALGLWLMRTKTLTTETAVSATA